MPGRPVTALALRSVFSAKAPAALVNTTPTASVVIAVRLVIWNRLLIELTLERQADPRPSIEIMADDAEGEAGNGGFNAFGHSDARTLMITDEAARLLAREPQPLRILVPVTIEGSQDTHNPVGRKRGSF